MGHEDIKILIVDDSPTMLRMLVNTLNMAGFKNVVQAQDGKDALGKLASESDIKLILSDWNMPVMTGIEFLKAVKVHEDHKNIPFMMITSRSIKEDIVEAIKSGAKSYVVKPFSPEVIKGKIDEILDD